jgi:hypothetical protein
LPIYLESLMPLTFIIISFGLIILKKSGYNSIKSSIAIRCYLLAVVASGYLFCIFAAEDWTGMARYFTPYMPSLCILLAYSIYCIWQKNLIVFRIVALVVSSIYIAAAFYIFNQYYNYKWAENYPGYVMISEPLIDPAEKFLSVLAQESPNRSIATRRIGLLSWILPNPVFDYAHGLTEKDVVSVKGIEIPRSPCAPELFEIWQKQDPIAIIEDRSVMEQIYRDCQGKNEKFIVHGKIYKLNTSHPINSRTSWSMAINQSYQ